MKFKFVLTLTILIPALFSCEENESTPSVTAPSNYTFERNGQSTVSFTGQTNRIKMAEEIGSAFLDFDNTTEALLLEMYRNADAQGVDASPFANAELNSAEQSIKSKVAASNVLFSANTAESAQIKAEFESWVNGQIEEIFPFRNQLASAGTAGQLADGNSTRYVNAKGLEYNQAFTKSLIGALMLDQMVNHYLSKAVLDGGSNRENNDMASTAEGNSYTTMEHFWDEAYGYLFGNAENLSDPMSELGNSDGYLNRYLGRVDADGDFTGIAQEIYEALKLGRAAIVDKQYVLRDAQAAIIQQKLSETIAIRAVYYLQQGKIGMENQQFGTAFHDFSEGLGFIYSLRFTHNPIDGTSFFSKAEVDQMIDDLYESTNGFWDLDGTRLDAISESIAAKFDFTVAQAGN
ncbi:MAG: hypothetical protein ACJAVN_001494 [Roseivirga sp.]|jgi:hypothetical protein